MDRGAVVEDDMYVQEAITPISPRAIASGRRPAPHLNGRRAHNNFVSTESPQRGGPVFAANAGDGQPFAGYRPSSAASKRRPPSGNSAKSVSTALTLRPGSAPGRGAKIARSTYDMNAWWTTPDETLLQTPRPIGLDTNRRPAAEELQQELTMTATVLRTAQSRLAEERESRLRARASEELAMVDLRRAKEEARAIREQSVKDDRQLAKALMAQRKELEGQLVRKDEEQELQLAHMQAERERAAEKMRQLHEDHARDLQEKLAEVADERDRLLDEQRYAHKKEAERIAKVAADQAAVLQAQANQKLDDEREKRVAHLGQIGIKRMLNHKLSMGWTAWREMHQTATRRRNLLKRAGYRLAKPMAAAAFKHWQDDWQSTQHKKAHMTLEQLLAEEIALRKAVQLELAQVCTASSVLSVTSATR